MDSMPNRQQLIRTVRGDLPSTPWGWTNSHAHLNCVLSSEFKDFPLYEQYANDDATFNFDDTFPDFELFAKAGGYALIDTTPIGLGRVPELLRIASERTDVHIIAATGIYHDPLIPKQITQMNDRQICQYFVEEITKGIGGTDIKAGMIKIATYKGPMTEMEKAIFRAAAWASQETGVSITTHTYLGRNALEQIDVLTKHGADPGQVVIGHLDDGDIDQDLIRAIVERGAYVQFDAIGCEYYTERLGSQMPTDEQRLETILALAEDGIAERVMIGSDLCRKKHLRKNGGPGFAHLITGFLDLARVIGVPQSLLEQCMISNPSNVLTMRKC
ncbi:MAG: hypothetical protein ABSG01_00275 [Anaerolineales bacterium]|jgi:phosphotriesterase-related protein